MFKIGFILAICCIEALASCPDFLPASNFDLASFAGEWRVHHLIANWDSNPRGFQCLHLNITSRDWTSRPSVSARIIGHGQTAIGSSYNEDYNVKIHDVVNDPARWDWMYSVFPGTSVILNQTGNYALMANCLEPRALYTPANIFINFLSRSFDPIPQSVIDHYRAMADIELTRNSIENTGFYNIQQSFRNCAAHVSN